MVSEPNHYSRNLKVVSIFFILYWLLGLAPADDSIRFVAINYVISNPEGLQFVSYVFLAYFGWRFHVNSRGLMMEGYRSSVSLSSSANVGTRRFKAVRAAAISDFRTSPYVPIGKQSRGNYDVQPMLMVYNGSELTVEYQALHPDLRPENTHQRISRRFHFTSYHARWIEAVAFLKFVVSKDEAADYFLPWLLCCFAIISCFLMQAGIGPKDIF